MAAYWVELEGGSRCGTDYGYWAMSNQGTGKHHLIKDYGSSYTKCGRAIPWNWIKIRRMTFLPPSLSDSKAARKGKVCRRCRSLA